MIGTLIATAAPAAVNPASTSEGFPSPDQIEMVVGWATNIGIALGIFVLGWLISKWGYSLTLKALRKGRLDEALSRFFASMVQWGLLAFAVIASLDKAGVETTSVAAVLAAAGLAVGLALQGSLGNFASGVLLLVFRPFTIGDRVTAAGYTGKVEDIGLFATTLSTPANERIILPNTTVTGDAIINHTASGKIRISIDAGVAYGADIDQVCAILLEAANESDLVLEDPGPGTAFVEMAASSLNFKVHCWAEPANGVAMQHQVRTAIYNKLNAAGVEIPFDQLVVHKAE
ncbi:MAG: mechanosensitive ion channel domain-containing protein [Acidobacteriota bacterium]